MEIAYNSTTPYNFTFAVEENHEEFGDKITTCPNDPYNSLNLVLFGLVLNYLKNVRLEFAIRREIIRRLSYVTEKKMDAKGDASLKFIAMIHGVIDTAAIFFAIYPEEPLDLHVSPITRRNADLIASSVSSDARMESSETLSFQGLPTSVWVLVGFSLLVVSGLVTYSSFKTENKIRPEKPFSSWMNNVCIYAADIVNNCVAGVVRQGPGRNLRSCWLLGVVFLMQFWAAGMKSDLLIHKTTFIDSFEDLLSKPELICFMSKYLVNRNPFGLTKDDPRYEDYRKMKKQYFETEFDENSEVNLVSGSGVVIKQVAFAMVTVKSLKKKLQAANKKQYVGKKKYLERYSYMLFNKRLPRAIKEDIDYLVSRLFETGQIEPRLRRDKFVSRKFMFDETVDSASKISFSAKSVTFLSPAFSLWIIGMSLATCAFCVEFYQLRRSAVKVSPRHSMGIWIRA